MWAASSLRLVQCLLFGTEQANENINAYFDNTRQFQYTCCRVRSHRIMISASGEGNFSHQNSLYGQPIHLFQRVPGVLS
jgi:hypothetical protein